MTIAHKEKSFSLLLTQQRVIIIICSEGTDCSAVFQCAIVRGRREQENEEEDDLPAKLPSGRAGTAASMTSATEPSMRHRKYSPSS